MNSQKVPCEIVSVSARDRLTPAAPRQEFHNDFSSASDY